MKRFFGLLCLCGVTCVVALTGCSKKEEVAIVPTTPAAPAAQASQDADSSDSSMSDDGSSSTDDGSSEETDDGSNSTEDDGSTTDDSGDDGTMAESEESMTEDDGSGVAIVSAKPKNLREQADQAFGDGLEKAAYRLIQAHMLASTADASELLAHYRWSPARKQPQLGMRIAIGVELTSPSELKDYKPIGSLSGFFSKRKPASRSRVEAVSDDESGDGNTVAAILPTNNKERILQKYAGLMGDVIVDYVKSGHSEGKWAPVFQSLDGVVSTAQQLSGGGDGSDDGSGGDEGSGSMMASAPKWPLATRVDGPEAKYISLGPTLSYVGRGTTAELLDHAKTGEFDALIVFDVDVTVNTKVRLIYNSCRAKMLNIADGKSIAASKLLKNTDAQKEIDKTGRSYVVTAMQPILTKLDELVTMQAIPPGLTPEIIKTKRLVTLLTDESRSKLDSVTEIRLWRERALLEDADVLSAYESLLGAEDGKALASGTDEERLVVVTKLLAGK